MSIFFIHLQQLICQANWWELAVKQITFVYFEENNFSEYKLHFKIVKYHLHVSLELPAT